MWLTSVQYRHFAEGREEDMKALRIVRCYSTLSHTLRLFFSICFTGEMEFEPLFAESDADDVDVVSLEQFPHTPAERAVGEPLYAQYRRRQDACYRRRAWPPPQSHSEPVAPPYCQLFHSEDTNTYSDAQMGFDAALTSKTTRGIAGYYWCFFLSTYSTGMFFCSCREWPVWCSTTEACTSGGRSCSIHKAEGQKGWPPSSWGFWWRWFWWCIL